LLSEPLRPSGGGSTSTLWTAPIDARYDRGAMRPEIRFTTSRDGVRIAWSEHGDGPPLVRVGTWLTHLQHDWESVVWRHWLTELGDRFTFVRYDDRGCGLSDREVPGLGLGAWIDDLEAVVDATGFSQVALLGMSQGAAIAVAYAARHPDRVSHVVCLGGYPRGGALLVRTHEAREEDEALNTLARLGWGRADPTFRRIFTGALIPGGTDAQMRWFDELQRQSTSGTMASRLMRARSRIDVSRLAGKVVAPALILHARDDAMVEFERGRELATLIPGAQFVPLEGRNHVLLADEPAWPRFLEALDAFFRQAPVAASRPPQSAATLPATGRGAGVSDRELEVLRLVAAGRSNAEIAEALTISVRTVERHLTNLYAKMGLLGRSARAAAAAQLPEMVRAPD
jgi:pimeloyl-ACP methyl ester carboxylesterase/DNA-binding CsgD family transcriptional regulator